MDQMRKLLSLLEVYRELGIDSQIDYEKFYLYSIITHSTAIEGSTVTELENQMLFDAGVSAKGKTISEQMMNLDLKAAYEAGIAFARNHTPLSIELLKQLAAIVMKNTGTIYNTALGEFSSANGDLRLVNVSAGVGGKSYLSYQKVPAALQEFCDWLNVERGRRMTVAQRYDLSFEAHYRLVTIHPWADGNGRMARLLMNYIQFEFGLIPAKVLKEDKGDYIDALVATRESGDLGIFLEFMTAEMVKTLSAEINSFATSTGEYFGLLHSRGWKKPKSRDRILETLSLHPTFSAQKLSDIIGISAKGVEKQLAILKAEGKIVREGPDKGGRWIVK